MEGIKNFDDFYDIKLKPFLAELEQKGNRAFGWGIAALLFALSVVPVLAFGLNIGIDGGGPLLIIIIIVGTVVSVYQYTRAKDDYEDRYKEQVVQQIIKFIHPGLEYKPGICINHTDYKNSSLCRDWYDDYDGEDWIGGNYKGVNFKCSELHVTRRTGSRSSQPMVYSGLFFAAPLNIAFSGGTYVWIKDNVQLAASIADERYRLLPMPEVVKVDCRNGEFEKYYAVYTTDIYEASSLINAPMMQAIVNFKKQINRDISLSFVAGVCYVSIPFTENLFEPDVDEPGNKEEIKKYFFTVLLILGIINQLRLNEL